jgi:type I restriction enzyme R subunit
MTKRALSETEICDRFITPALQQAGWLLERMRREYSFTDGRIIVRGRLVSRGRRKRADYLLVYEGVPLAVIEAKDNSHAIGDGLQQALAYAKALNTPFVFASNGDGFVFHDRTGQSEERETTLALEAFPSPEDLRRCYSRWKGFTPQQEKVVLHPYFVGGKRKDPRYYQINAIQATVEAITKGQQRILLVMATGTGKTFTAFQIIWRLWKAGQKKRILFLADRNVLVNQTMVNDFRPFGPAMAKLSTASKTIERTDGSLETIALALNKQRRIDTSYEVYLGLYQALTGPEERQKLYKEFSPGFFDLIVVDECHRGSAAEDSAWREILEYFSAATQIGLTATPKETKYVSNIDYFGEPLYTYSLKQGMAASLCVV